MTSFKTGLRFKNVNGHVEIFDFFNRFICSGDDEEDALEGLQELLESYGGEVLPAVVQNEWIQ